MGFMTGVLRLLGAAEDEPELDHIVEYPAAARRDESSVSARIIDMPEAGERMTMCVFRPQIDGEEPQFSMRAYASQLLDRKAILVDVNDLAEVDLEEATRVVDYLSGVAEAVSGSVYEMSKNIFIFAPSNVALDGDPLKQVEVY